MKDIKNLPVLSPEEKQMFISQLKQQRKKKYMGGVTMDNQHFDLKIFITYPEHHKEDVPQYVERVVHISHKYNTSPAFSTQKYYCKNLNKAWKLALKMKEDRGIDIVVVD